MIKMLLADDEGIVLQSLQHIIEKNFGTSCEVKTAKTGREVIRLARDSSGHCYDGYSDAWN